MGSVMPFADEEGPEAAVAQQDGVDGAALGDGGEVDLGLGGSAAKLVIGEEEPDDAARRVPWSRCR